MYEFNIDDGILNYSLDLNSRNKDILGVELRITIFGIMFTWLAQ